MTPAAFKSWRNGNGLTIAEAAKLLQVHPATIKRWQNRGPSKFAAAVQAREIFGMKRENGT